ncbi:MAG: OmpA family protein [Alphaproteobacteria bacterium]|nr:OmpA family protein [Alphaproteobacteria bacterium]
MLVPAMMGVALASPAVSAPPITQPKAVIPLCAGLQIVTAVSQANGDYESIKTVEGADDQSVRISYASESLETDFLSEAFGQMKSTKVARTLRREDLLNANFYQQRFFADMPALVPESTVIGTSSAVLKTLKAKGSVEFRISNAYSGEPGIDRQVRPNVYDFQNVADLVIDRTAAVTVPVIVNDVKVDLPAIRATADFAGDKAEFFFLDDEANPLTLKFRIGIDAVAPPNKEMIELCKTMQGTSPDMSKALCGQTQGGDAESLQVVKISYRCAVPAQIPVQAQPAEPPAAVLASPIEQALAETGKAEIYDIYFSFDSDRLREESAPSLKEIADVLTRHPAWRLAVNGHTDSVAGDAYNLDLSARRAAAVKAALIAKYRIDPKRLETAGFGETQPKDTNVTLQGRARNRRVELVKQ